MVFRKNGYTTLSFGKVFHGNGRGDGFGWSEPAWQPPNWACYVNFDEARRRRENLGAWRPAMEIFDGPESAHGDYQTADQAIAALDGMQEKPFFLAVGFYKPHLPFVAPKAFWDLYEQRNVVAPEPTQRAIGAADYGYAFSEIASYGRADGRMFDQAAPPNRSEANDLTRAYYASVSFIDAQIGRVLKRLEELKLTESTIVVLWGDHGFHLGDQGRWAKWTQFEADMRSPLIIRLPRGQAPPRHSNALVESVDIYPTLASLVGLPVPSNLDGADLTPLLRGSTDSHKSAAFSQVAGLQKNRHLMAYTVRTATHRYVEWRNRNDGNSLIHRELYDLSNASDEMENAAGEPSNSALISDLARQVAEGFPSLRSTWSDPSAAAKVSREGDEPEAAEFGTDRPAAASEKVNVIKGKRKHTKMGDPPVPPHNPTDGKADQLSSKGSPEGDGPKGGLDVHQPKAKSQAGWKNSPLVPADPAISTGGATGLDLYLLMGQSNMKGRGEIPDSTLGDARILMLHARNNRWYVARHPLHLVGDPETFAGADNAGVGPGLSFAQEIALSGTTGRIGLIPCAVGGSSIERWRKGADLYELALDRLRVALATPATPRPTLKAVLWLQGEADARPDRVGSYPADLLKLIDDLRTDTGLPNLPFIACTIAEKKSGPSLPHRRAINETLLGIAAQRQFSGCVDARDLATKDDNVHYDTTSQVEIGRRFAEVLQEISK